MQNHIVIMAGGIGSRLWPMSSPELPKQFIDVLGTGRTLLQMTVERFLPVCPIERFWVVTSEKYVSLVKEQVPGIPSENILAEPAARNTAPCIAYSCRKISSRYPDANIVVTPADALVLDREQFISTIQCALDFTAGGSRIVTVGIKPTRPETGYGYICAEKGENPLCKGNGKGIIKVSQFKEKPDLETAQRYLDAGNYQWNAGIFVWNAVTINEQLGRWAPQIASVMDELEPFFYTKDERAKLAELFPTCEKISIDYAVMEKSPDIYTISCDPGWSDLGSWGSVKSHITPDADGNSTVGGDVRLFDCRRCIVHVPDEEIVVVQGLEDYIVARKNGKLVICKLSEEQHIKEYSAKQLRR